jgi:hypothetical protein
LPSGLFKLLSLSSGGEHLDGVDEQPALRAETETQNEPGIGADVRSTWKAWPSADQVQTKG